MRQRIPNITLILAVALLASCNSPSNGKRFDKPLYTPRYAEKYAVCLTDGQSSAIEIRNPWQGAQGVVKQLFVSRQGERAPEWFDGQTVVADPKRVVCFSSSHVAMIDALGLADRIVGVSAADYLSCPRVVERYRQGLVREVGYDSNINYEVLIALRPDAVFIYGTQGENSAVTGKLQELGIPTVYVSDYLEEHPLGKSEWIRFFGEIFDRRKEAESVFDGIAERYETTRRAALALTEHPSVIFNAPYRDVWFAPSDNSYMVRLVEDAGGSYVCRGTAGNRSRPLAAESAYRYAMKADLWLNPNSARTMAQLITENPKYADIPAVKNRRVYNCTARQTAGGGSDFWESGSLRADLALADMVAMIHPTEPNAPLYYFERLE